MLTPSQAQDRATHLISLARSAGADAADSVYASSGSTDVQVRLGALEDVQRSENEEIGLRVFLGKRSATASSSDLSLEALTALAERAVAMAREAPEDEFAGLAPEERLMRGAMPDFDIDDGLDVSPEDLRARALEAENAARAVPGVTNSEGGSASAGRGVIGLATSHGFAGAYAGSSHGTSASVLAGEGADMQRDYAYDSVRHLSDLKSAAAIGREAGENTVGRLNPVRLKSGAMPIIFDPRVGPSLIGHFAGAIIGSGIARKTSFLKDALQTAVFAKGIHIIDDPHRVRGLRSKPFDGEGLATHVSKLVDDGVLTNWLMDSASARQLGLAPTGHAQRGVSGAPGAGITNLHMAAGDVTVAALMQDIKLGFYVTELIGQGVSGLTGDYSRGASGFVIRDGAIAEAVSEVTIAGNLKAMFAALTPADDLSFKYAVNTPTLRVDGMMLAGD